MVKLVPLQGAKHFSDLMRLRPLAHFGTCTMYAQWSTLPNDNLLKTPVIELGQVVPKKAYPLAVDRNRVRRLLRAHSLTAGQSALFSVPNPIKKDRGDSGKGGDSSRLSCQVTHATHVMHASQTPTDIARLHVQLLFRIKPIDKKTRFVGLTHQANPHTQAFSLAVRSMLEKTFAKLNQV